MSLGIIPQLIYLNKQPHPLYYESFITSFFILLVGFFIGILIIAFREITLKHVGNKISILILIIILSIIAYIFLKIGPFLFVYILSIYAIALIAVPFLFSKNVHKYPYEYYFFLFSIIAVLIFAMLLVGYFNFTKQLSEKQLKSIKNPTNTNSPYPYAGAVKKLDAVAAKNAAAKKEAAARAKTFGVIEKVILALIVLAGIGGGVWLLRKKVKITINK